MAEIKNKAGNEEVSPKKKKHRLPKKISRGLAFVGLAAGLTTSRQPPEPERLAEALLPPKLSEVEPVFYSNLPSPEVIINEVAPEHQQTSIPLIDRKAEIPKTINLVDMNLSGKDKISYEIQSGDTLSEVAIKKGLPLELVYDAYKRFTGEENPAPNLLQPGTILKIEVDNWFDAELEYGELAKDIPIYNFSYAKSLDELDSALKNNLYPSIAENANNPEIRKIELFIKRSVIDKFKIEGISFVGWANRHTGLLNSLLMEQDLDLRVSLGRVIIVDDEALKDLDEDYLSICFLWGLNPYSLPTEYHNRWFVADDYRKGAYYNEPYDIDIGWNHEMGHYFLGLWDIYPLDENQKHIIYISGENQEPISLKVPQLTYPADWLMRGNRERPILSPFSVAALKHLKKLGISSWMEASDYWHFSAFEEISQNFFAQFKDPKGNILKQGSVFIFISKYEKKYDKKTNTHQHERQYDSNADFIFNLNEGEEKTLLNFDPSGYASIDNAQSSFAGRGKNFVVIIKTEDGNLFSTHLTSLDFLLATWETEEGKIPSLTIEMSEIESDTLDISSELIKKLEDKNIATHKAWSVGQSLDFETDETGRILTKEDTAKFDSQVQLIAEKILNSNLPENGLLSYRVGTDLSNVPVLFAYYYDSERKNILGMICPDGDYYQFISPPGDPKIEGIWMFYKKGLAHLSASNPPDKKNLIWKDGNWYNYG